MFAFGFCAAYRDTRICSATLEAAKLTAVKVFSIIGHIPASTNAASV